MNLPLGPSSLFFPLFRVAGGRSFLSGGTLFFSQAGLQDTLLLFLTDFPLSSLFDHLPLSFRFGKEGMPCYGYEVTCSLRQSLAIIRLLRSPPQKPFLSDWKSRRHLPLSVVFLEPLFRRSGHFLGEQIFPRPPPSLQSDLLCLPARNPP